MDAQSSLSAIFGVIIVGFLILDLGYFNKNSHRIAFKPALWQSLFWVSISIVFSFLIFILMPNGKDLSSEFLAAYVTEKLLSVDNLFVIMIIFDYFKLEEKYHHRVLFWGIIGAIFFRALFIGAGSILIGRFHWVLYVFGVMLIYSGISLLREKKEEHVDLKKSRMLRAAGKILPLSQRKHGGKFFVREKGKLRVTTLFLIMLLVEETDIIFAFDSIPAVFSISQNFFIVFSSNIFAIMGLRSLFFLLESVLSRFKHLQKGLAAVLMFVGGKMLLDIWHIHIPSTASLLIILGILGLSVLVSNMDLSRRKFPVIGGEA